MDVGIFSNRLKRDRHAARRMAKVLLACAGVVLALCACRQRTLDAGGAGRSESVGSLWDGAQAMGLSTKDIRKFVEGSRVDWNKALESQLAPEALNSLRQGMCKAPRGFLKNVDGLALSAIVDIGPLLKWAKALGISAGGALEGAVFVDRKTHRLKSRVFLAPLAGWSMPLKDSGAAAKLAPQPPTLTQQVAAAAWQMVPTVSAGVVWGCKSDFNNFKGYFVNLGTTAMSVGLGVDEGAFFGNLEAMKEAAASNGGVLSPSSLQPRTLEQVIRGVYLADGDIAHDLSTLYHFRATDYPQIIPRASGLPFAKTEVRLGTQLQALLSFERENLKSRFDASAKRTGTLTQNSIPAGDDFSRAFVGAELGDVFAAVLELEHDLAMVAFPILLDPGAAVFASAVPPPSQWRGMLGAPFASASARELEFENLRKLILVDLKTQRSALHDLETVLSSLLAELKIQGTMTPDRVRIGGAQKAPVLEGCNSLTSPTSAIGSAIALLPPQLGGDAERAATIEEAADVLEQGFSTPSFSLSYDYDTGLGFEIPRNKLTDALIRVLDDPCGGVAGALAPQKKMPPPN